MTSHNPATVNRLIGQRIKERREYLKRTQLELAQYMGKRTKSTVAQIETGFSGMNAADLAAAADFLQCPVAYFFGDAATPTPEHDIVAYYRALSSEEQGTVRTMLKALAEARREAS